MEIQGIIFIFEAIHPPLIFVAYTYRQNNFFISYIISSFPLYSKPYFCRISEIHFRELYYFSKVCGSQFLQIFLNHSSISIHFFKIFRSSLVFVRKAVSQISLRRKMQIKANRACVRLKYFEKDVKLRYHFNMLKFKYTLFFISRL